MENQDATHDKIAADAVPAQDQSALPYSSIAGPQQRLMFLDSLIVGLAQNKMLPPGVELLHVYEFNQKFGLLVNERPTHLTKAKLKERIEFLLEELLEFVEAAGLGVDVCVDQTKNDGRAHQFSVFDVDPDQNLAGQADALVDLVYVALGTVAMLGLPWGALWLDVQRANMGKVPGPTHRGHKHDAMKPPGWAGPQTEKILSVYGYNRGAWVDVGGVVDDRRCVDDLQQEKSDEPQAH